MKCCWGGWAAIAKCWVTPQGKGVVSKWVVPTEPKVFRSISYDEVEENQEWHREALEKKQNAPEGTMVPLGATVETTALRNAV